MHVGDLEDHQQQTDADETARLLLKQRLARLGLCNAAHITFLKPKDCLDPSTGKAQTDITKALLRPSQSSGVKAS